MLIGCAALLSAPTATARGGCTAQSASAIDQYCELVPTPGGAQPPRSTDPKLGGTLPRRLLRIVLRHPAQTRALGGLPARVLEPRRSSKPGRPSPPPVQDSGVGWWSISFPVVAILAAIAVGLAIWTVVDRRRRRLGERAHGSPG